MGDWEIVLSDGPLVPEIEGEYWSITESRLEEIEESGGNCETDAWEIIETEESTATLLGSGDQSGRIEIRLEASRDALTLTLLSVSDNEASVPLAIEPGDEITAQSVETDPRDLLGC